MPSSAILINDTQNENHLGSKQVIQNIKELCLKNEVKIISTFTRKDIQEWCTRLDDKLKICDIIIINGEGSLYNTANWLSILINNILYVKKELFKNHKIILINSLWQNMKHPSIYKFLDRLDLISLRESLSCNEMVKDYKKDNKILIVPDVIFATEIPDLTIGFGDSVIPETDKTLMLHYNNFPMHNSKQPDLNAYLAWLKSLTFYITGRYHGVCLSILVGTPFCAYKSNSHKIEGLLKDMKCEHLLMDITKKVDILKLDFVILRERMKEYRIEAKQKIEDLFHRIGEL